VKFEDSEIVDRNEYTVFEGEGRVKFKVAPEMGQRIEMKYIKLPEYKSEKEDYYQPFDDSNSYFEIEGSKNFTITLTQGKEPSLDQGTRLNFKGRVGSVDFAGSLTDEQLPIQPEGTTEELTDIDKISVEMSGNNFDLMIGDLEVSSGDTKFADYDKHLLGLDSSLFWNNNNITGLISREKGYHYQLEFKGSEGVQGPYIIEVEGEEYVVVIAGSERVYVNGERVKRGEGNDYIIDYQEPSITFTQNVPITEETRITLEFEYTGLGYKRTFFNPGTHFSTEDNRLNLDIAYIREVDSKDEDLIALSDEEKKILYKAGDDYKKAQRLKYNEDNEPVYEYVGEGKGDYIRNWDPIEQKYIYEYVGEGDGDYAQMKYQIPMPVDHHLMDIKLGLMPVEYINIDLELAGSFIDRNTYSPYDDGDNLGGAGSLEIISKIPFSDDTSLSFSLSGEGREYMFASLKGLEDVHLRDIWELEGDVEGYEISPSYYFLEGGSKFSSGDDLEVSSFYGFIRRDYSRFSSFWNEQSGRCYRLDSEYDGLFKNTFNIKVLKYNSSYIEVDDDVGEIDEIIEMGKDYFELETDFKKDLWIFSPGFDFAFNRVRVDLEKDGKFDKGELIRSYKPGLGIYPSRWLKLNFGFSNQKSFDMVRDKFLAYSFSRGYSGGLDISRNIWSVNIDFSSKRTFYRDITREDVYSDLGSIDFRISPERRLFFISGRYKVSSEVDYEREEIFEIAKDGNGDYRREEDPNNPGRYIYIYDPDDEEAIYIRILRPTGGSFMVMDVEGFLTGEINFWRFSEGENSGYSLLNSTFRASFSSNNRTDDPKRFRVLTFLNRLNKYTIRGSVRQSYSLKLFTVGCRISPDFGFERTSSLNRETIHTSQKKWQNIYSIKTFFNLSTAINLTTMFKLSSYHSRYSSSGLELIRKTDGKQYEFEVETVILPAPIIRFTIAGNGLFMKEVNDNLRTDAYRLSFEPRSRIHITEEGTLNLLYKLKYVQFTGNSGSYFFIINPPGYTNMWSVDYSYTINQYTTLTFLYSGEKEPDRDIKNEVRFDVSLYF
jgi:hypothetical protein